MESASAPAGTPAGGAAGEKGLKPNLVFGYAPPPLIEREAADHLAALEEVARNATASAVERAGQSGVEAEPVLLAKQAVAALVGSVPHKLLQVSERPVLVVRG
jgi:hypothetical protein